MEVLKLETWINEFGQERINLDKVQEYLDFIIKARDRYDPERYSEWHHVMPKCLDTGKRFRDQGVQINGRDHFLAHMKLVECFEGKKRYKLACALIRMNKSDVSPEEVEIARKSYSDSIKGENNPIHRIDHSGVNNPMYGRTGRAHHLHKSNSVRITNGIEMKYIPVGTEIPEGWYEGVSDSYRRNMSEAVSGENNGMYGKCHSDESNRKNRESHLGKKASQETIQKMKSHRKGNPNFKPPSPEGKIFINNGTYSKLLSPEDAEVYLSKGWTKGRVSRKRCIA